ncbi:Nitrogen permease regulator 3, partial [Coemansia aciculifera]
MVFGRTTPCANAVVTDRELQPGESDRYPRIEPHHAILLLGDAEALVRRLRDYDASPTLLAIVESAQPTEPLSELHARVDCSFAQLCRFAAHLVYWGVAKLICPVKLAHTYVPTAFKMTAALAERFSRLAFNLCSLSRLLASLHPPRPAELVLRALLTASEDGLRLSDEALSARVRDCKPEFRDVLAFLLREGAIAQYHMWPVLLVPSYTKLDLNEAQFVRLMLGWFRTLHTEHPDLLGAFPHALLDTAEYECWRTHEAKERADAEIIRNLNHDAESRINLYQVMRKLALRRVHEAGSDLKRGKHGRELLHAERKADAEERKVIEFCTRLETEGMDTLISARNKYLMKKDLTRKERIQDRRAHGKDISDDDSNLPAAQLCKWYDFVKRDLDMNELTKEIVSKYVSY